MTSAEPVQGRRLVYDHQIFSSQRFGGVSRYFSELARHLSAAGSWDVEVLALAHVNAYLPSLDQGIVRGRRVTAVPKTGRIRQAFDTGLTRALLARNPPDIVHETYYARRPSGPATVPSVVTVFDMICEKFPQYFRDAAALAVTKARAVHRAEHVICISESTRNDLMERMRLDPSRVAVVHLGSSISEPPESSGPPNGLEGKQYLLYVGERGGHKNFSGLLSALSLRPSILGNYLLVLYGGGPITQAERARIRDHDLPEAAIIHLGSDDTLLGRLYRHASALVYPSLYEGFGIPILEAMSCRCPVVCGSTSSISEVAGNAAAYCDATDPESIADVLVGVLASSDHADMLRALGKERHRLFSWGKCAAETDNIYRLVLESRTKHLRGTHT